ncbi:MAG: hypothetical protein ABI706_02735 [Ilumatobacteraceae bacterium]
MRTSSPRHLLAASTVAFALAAAGCSSSGSTRAAHDSTIASTVSAAPTTDRQAALRADMRKLWEDHITWTRLYIIAAEAGSADTDATATRLLQNQTDIGNAIKPLYGDAAGTQLTALLRDHILTAGDLIAAAKAGDTAKVATDKDKWYANADAIADFLAAANPANWPATEMRQMMHDHLDNTLAEAVDHLGGKYAADIADYDKVHTQILAMADMLTNGIIAQFPDKFA